MKKIISSPLVHFFFLGALVFAGYAAVKDEPVVSSPNIISLDKNEADRLVQNFVATWNRPPTVEQLENLMQSWALEEAYVREALSLGLDRGDAVIRQRLNQKMLFLAETGAVVLEPDEAVLRSFRDENPDRFMKPDRIAFEQIILPQDRNPAAIIALLEDGADPSNLGPASLLPPTFPMTAAPVIDRTFGEGFYLALQDLPIGRWQGPVKSGYGLHIVRVNDRAEAFLPPLSEIRDRVEAEWRATQTEEMRESFGQALLTRYQVSLPDAEQVLGQ